MTVLIVKNLVGGLFVAAGIVMLFMPGQGILTILIGLSLLDLPGKRAFERRLVGSPAVFEAINVIRAPSRPTAAPAGNRCARIRHSKAWSATVEAISTTQSTSSVPLNGPRAVHRVP